MALPPSGSQHVLAVGDTAAVVVEVGGGVRSLRCGGRELLDGYAEQEMATAARGQVLVPWPNRVGDGRYRWDGEEHQLPLSEPEAGNAIHGLARWAGWSVVGKAVAEVELEHVVVPQPGYPFRLAVRVHYRLADDGLTVTTTARNTGHRPLPYASGQHPYLATGGTVDDCVLTSPGATALGTDDRGLPTGRTDVGGTGLDLRSGRRVGDTELDTAFTDLVRDADGRAELRLERPDGGGARLWVDAAYPWLELFTGDSLPQPERRRRGLGVEPMTAPPDAFRSGTDVVRLEPGEEHTARWGLSAL